MKKIFVILVAVLFTTVNSQAQDYWESGFYLSYSSSNFLKGGGKIPVSKNVDIIGEVGGMINAKKQIQSHFGEIDISQYDYCHNIVVNLGVSYHVINNFYITPMIGINHNKLILRDDFALTGKTKAFFNCGFLVGYDFGAVDVAIGYMKTEQFCLNIGIRI